MNCSCSGVNSFTPPWRANGMPATWETSDLTRLSFRSILGAAMALQSAVRGHDLGADAMPVTISRRGFLVGTALTATMPAPAFAQPKPLKIGLLTVKTGPLPAGGIQMEQGTVRFF